MGRLIEKFKNIEIGRLVYIIRCLELKGLVELTKNTLRPSLVTNFYDKAKFRMSGNEWKWWFDFVIFMISKFLIIY